MLLDILNVFHKNFFLLTNGILVKQLLQRFDCSILARPINVYYNELVKLFRINTSH